MLIHGATDIDIHPALFGGAQRTLGLYRGLARDHDVRALCLVPNRSRGPREERVDGIAITRRKAWFTSLAWRLEQARVSPLFLAAHGHRARADALRREFGGTPDVLMTDFNLAGLLDRSDARLRVHHAQNVEYDHFRFAGPPLLATGFWAERLRQMEARAVGAADLVVAASDEDADRLRALYSLPSERVLVAPNGYDETATRPPTAAARERARAALGIAAAETVCAFVGSDVPHNRAGLALLVDRVMPALAGSGVRLLVIGRVTRALAGRRESWLIAGGEPVVLADLLDAADVGLNPVIAGGGSNVKLPTYLAAGLAVVTTAHGLRGFASLAPFVTVAEPEAMADALRLRPAGWAKAVAPAPPAPLADCGWGGIGGRLGEAFAARLARGPRVSGGAIGADAVADHDGRRKRA